MCFIHALPTSFFFFSLQASYNFPVLLLLSVLVAFFFSPFSICRKLAVRSSLLLNESFINGRISAWDGYRIAVSFLKNLFLFFSFYEVEHQRNSRVICFLYFAADGSTFFFSLLYWHNNISSKNVRGKKLLRLR